MADEYIEEIIRKGDDGSDIIHAICKQTHGFNKRVVEIDSSTGGLTGVRFPKNKNVVIHSAGGDPAIEDTSEYIASLVDRLVEQAHDIGVKPIAMTDTMDVPVIDLDVIRTAAKALYRQAKKHKVAVINGELAGLGYECVASPINASGTMISATDTSHADGIHSGSGFEYAVFNHEGKLIFANSDGVGTKLLIYQRLMNAGIAQDTMGVQDAIAMVADDAIKKGAEIKYIAMTTETRTKTALEDILRSKAKELSRKAGFDSIMHVEHIGKRINGYGDSPYNLNATTISLIDDETLKNPPVSQPDDYILAIRDPKNLGFRSNGITKLRQGLAQVFGADWHKEQYLGKNVAELAAVPSTVFYPAFRKLWENKLATAFYHMSGGAHKGKLARPLAKHNLYAEISDLFEPPELMQLLLEKMNINPDVACELWNNGNEAYITTKAPVQVTHWLYTYGLESRLVGAVRAAENNKTGLTIKLHAKEIYYSGKDK